VRVKVRLRDIEIDSIRSKIGLGESKIDLGESEIGLGESEIGRMLFSILHWPTIFRRI
jgi:hypothetical protein